jgi:hypothetical protein
MVDAPKADPAAPAGAPAGGAMKSDAPKTDSSIPAGADDMKKDPLKK